MTMTEDQTKAKGPRALTKYEEAGVPKEWLNDRGRFKAPGLDARYKSQLIREALDHEAANRGRKGSPAHRMLDRLGWTSHLDKSRESREAKAAKKANGKVDSAKTE
jgi:hypothetical protein